MRRRASIGSTRSSFPRMEPAALEKLAIETFARVRDRFEDQAKNGNISLAFEIVPEQAKVVDGNVWVTVRTVVWEHDGETQSIRDVKEQELSLVPPGGTDELIPAYLEGLALGIRRV